MNASAFKAVLQKNIEQIITVAFVDGEVCRLKPLTVDDEGFVYEIADVPGAAAPDGSPFWTRFDDIVRIEQTTEEF